MSVEGFKGHVATDGSLLGTAGKWRACGWCSWITGTIVRDVRLDGSRNRGTAHHQEVGADGLLMRFFLRE